MRKKRIIMYGCMVALAVSMVAGCGKNDNQSDENSQTTSEEQSQSGTRKEQGGPEGRDGSQMVQVTEVEDNTITAKVAKMPQGGESGEKPEGTPPPDGGSGEKPEGTPPPDRGSGEKPEGTPPPDGGSGQKPEGTPPSDGGNGQESGGRGRGNFEFSDETISIHVTSATKITKGGRDDSVEASISDIRQNSVLRVVIDDSNQAESIQIMEERTD